jgi:gamma-tubulin complex component 5
LPCRFQQLGREFCSSKYPATNIVLEKSGSQRAESQMAQTTAVNTILGNLVTSISHVSNAKNPREYKHLKESAAKTAKQQQFVRTNQFEVEASLNGLVEKFSVKNRDDLSEALATRLRELRKVSTSKWTPEVLSLFLNLSDRPVENSSVEALELLCPPTPPTPSITWEEIIADNPLTGDLWADETYSTASSEDELEIRVTAKSSTTGREIKDKPDTADQSKIPTALLVPVETERLKAVREAQFWKAASSPSGTQQISELQAIREVYSMLHGLPTSLFTVDLEHSLVFYGANIKLTGISVASFNDLLQSLASIGSDILGIRAWVRTSQRTALLQALNASTALRLRQFDRQLAGEEQRLVDPSTPVIVTLLQLHETIREMSRPLVHLGQLVASVPNKGFTCLEMLYDKICISQAAEDASVHELLARVFFECLKVYLRPVRRWMEAGDAVDGDDTFFISVADKECSAASLWHDRFTLRIGQDGQLYAPKFLHPAAKKILNSGKSIVFLKELLQQGFSPSVHTEPTLDYGTVCQPDPLVSLAPFSELFGIAFDGWISSKYSHASSILREQLFDNCGLPRYLEQLQSIYLSKDGTIFQAFADEIFQRMDNRQKSWSDRFLLSELARGVFGSQKHVDASRISVRTAQAKGADRSVKPLSTIIIELNVSRCH